MNVNAVNQLPTVGIDVGAQVQDILDYIGFKSKNGNLITFAGVDLSIQKTVGVGFKGGGNYQTSKSQPHEFSLPALNPVTFRYRNQDGTEGSDVSLIDPTTWDNGGTTTAVTNSSNATIQRVFIFPSNIIRIQRGQQQFTNFSTALAQVGTESFIEETNIAENGLYLGSIITRKDTTNLSVGTDAVFVSPIGEVSSASVNTTLQASYNVSLIPQITTDATNGAFTLQRGSALDTDTVFDLKNGAGTSTFGVGGDGNVIANSISVGGPSTSFLKADGSLDTSSYALGSHTHTLSDVTDVTATFGELNLLDLSGLTVGWVLSADTATTASWKAPTGGGNVAADVIWDAAGDLAVGSGADTAARLARGTANQVLTVNAGGTDLEWRAPAAGSGDVATDIIWDAVGDLAVGSGADTSARLARGAALDVLRVNAAGTDLEWATNAAGATTLPGLSDVTSAAVTNRYALVADGAAYVGRALVTADISDWATTVEAYITDAPTKALLDGTGNWDIDGVYTGTAVTGTFQGQKHFNTAYFFEAYNDNLWLRMPRG